MVDSASQHNDSACPDSEFVSFDQVQKTYDGEVLVVRDLSLHIARGEFLTMLGPSGSGKTTCLLMLAGFESPTSGTIRLDGKMLQNIPPHKRDIGLVFQNYALFPHMTVAENLAFPLKVRNVSREEIAERVGKTLEIVRLSGFENRMPAQLSGGQQQRVAVARALIFEPKIVLMDEPLGALDKNLREEMQLEIRQIHRTLGITVIYVTHDQSEALTMSSRVAVFNDGVIEQVASPRDLYDKPESAFVACFVGENNHLDGVVGKRSGRVCEVVLPSGEHIRALNVHDCAEGQKVCLSLRPEHIQLGRQSSSCENSVHGSVAEKIYLGDHMRLRFKACGQEDFVVKASASMEEHAVGSKVKLGWGSEHCRALPLLQD